MSRNFTVTFASGAEHVFNNVPSNVTEAQVRQRALEQFPDFGGVSGISGGGTAPKTSQYTDRLSAVTPEQARGAYRTQRQRIAERYTGEQRTRALAAYDAHPASLELRNIAAGRPASRSTPAMDVQAVNAPRSREERRDFLRSEGRQIANDRRTSGKDVVPSQARALVGGLGQGMFGAGQAVEAGLDVLTGATPLNFSDQLEVRRGMTSADQAAHPVFGLTGNVLGAIAGGGGLAGAARGGLGVAARVGVPGATQAGNVLQGLLGYEGARRGATVGQNVLRTASNLGKASAVGGAAGAAQAVGEGSDNVGQQAAIGAIAGPVGTAAVRGISKGANAVMNAVSKDRAQGKVLRELISEPVDALEARRAQMSAAVGREVPVAAALKDGDFREVVDRTVRRNDQTAEKATEHARSQVNDFMQFMTRHVANAGRNMDPAARNVASEAEGRPGAIQTSLRALNAHRDKVMDDAMSPIRDTEVDISTVGDGNEIIRDAISQIGRNTLELRKEIRDILGDPANGVAAAWGLGGDAVKLTVREADHLRQALSSASRSAASNPANAQAFSNAANALSDVMTRQVPAYREALDAYAANSRVIDGFDAAFSGKRIDDIADRQDARNLSSEEGRIGMALGELARQRALVSGNVDRAFAGAQRMAQRGDITRPPVPQGMDPDFAPRPGSVTENVSPRAAETLADAAEVESQVMRRNLDASKASAGPREGATTGLNPSDLMYGAMLGGAMNATKARFLARVMDHLGGKVRPDVAENIVDMMFSRDPDAIRNATSVLRAAGVGEDEVARMMTGAIGTGAVSGSVLGRERQPTSGISVEDVNTGEVVDVPNPDVEVVEEAVAIPVEASDSPYYGDLTDLYENENPQFLDLVNRLLMQESGSRQTDDNGNPITSSAGAIGIAQVMPDTGPEAAADAGLPWDEDAYRNDEAYNLLIGSAYLAKLLNKYGGDVAKALGAYNGGMGRVDAAVERAGDAWLDLMPAETQNYVMSVS